MLFSRKSDVNKSGKVALINISQITPNPSQPRSIFDEKKLIELAVSIKQFGIIQPISVRRKNEGFELIAGERRLRAAKLAGIDEVPCMILEADDKQSSLIALIENLQRRDLDFFEEALGLLKLIQAFGLSQEEAARKLGKSQSAVANKLRILKHPQHIIDLLRENNLTERHARALLRIEDVDLRYDTAVHICSNFLNVQQTENYIDTLLNPVPMPEISEPKEKVMQTPSRNKNKPIFIIKDIRLCINSINHAVDIMRSSGVDAAYSKVESDDNLVLTITIPKSKV